MGRYEKNRENQCFVMWVTADRNLRNLRIAESLCPVSGKQWKSSDSSGRISDEWGEKEVPWETEENVLPGGLISKIPRIVNDGADCYVRAKIVFTSEETSDQPLSADNLEGIGSEWVQDGEYFYCKEVVKSGESVDFFRGIRLPAEWKESPEAENRWQASVRAEAVQAECFFPDFSVSDPWGMKTKQFVIRQAMEGEAEEQDGDKDQMELVIASDLQGFTMEQEGCMKQLETFMPGKVSPEKL